MPLKESLVGRTVRRRQHRADAVPTNIGEPGPVSAWSACCQHPELHDAVAKCIGESALDHELAADKQRRRQPHLCYRVRRRDETRLIDGFVIWPRAESVFRQLAGIAEKQPGFTGGLESRPMPNDITAASRRQFAGYQVQHHLFLIRRRFDRHPERNRFGRERVGSNLAGGVLHEAFTIRPNVAADARRLP